MTCAGFFPTKITLQFCVQRTTSPVHYRHQYNINIGRQLDSSVYRNWRQIKDSKEASEIKHAGFNHAYVLARY